jgi:hypothetical protein
MNWLLSPRFVLPPSRLETISDENLMRLEAADFACTRLDITLEQ